MTPIRQDIKKGRPRFYPYPIDWNYGMLPQTWEDPQKESRYDELAGAKVVQSAWMPCRLVTVLHTDLAMHMPTRSIAEA